VHGGDPDHLLGVVHVKEVFGLPRENRADVPLSVLVKQVAMVPESKPLDELLGELRDAAAHLAVVLDEYGGTAGLVTIEDLVEEIVGDIADEHDPPDALQRTQTWRGAQILPGLLHPDEVFESCGFEVPEGRYETLAGYVLHELGHIPGVGEEFTRGGWRIRVVDVERHRVAGVQIVAPPPGEPVREDEP
jgi:CBS domain containing-hemolysin-like protein